MYLYACANEKLSNRPSVKIAIPIYCKNILLGISVRPSLRQKVPLAPWARPRPRLA